MSGRMRGWWRPAIQFNSELAQVRAGVLNRLDAADKLRYSHENPDIAKLYADWIGEPLSHTAHEWLHTDRRAGRFDARARG